MYAEPMAERYAHCAELVGVYDINGKRANLLRQRTKKDFPVFDSYGRMLDQAKPDVVIVTTVDRYHHEYAIGAMEAGCDVILEKPMTIDAAKCNAILEAERRTGHHATVTFNYRFSPFASRLKELLLEGIIGDLYSVHFEWLLDTRHGADYFRRWHRRKENSGGLLVHKATHHFDLVNWLLDEEPVAVHALGSRRFYGPTRDRRSDRCLTCPWQTTCEYYMDIRQGENHDLYYACEDVDGYYRDGCVFSEEIDIEDTMSLNVLYSAGAMMSYSLTAHSPYEGYRICLNGSEGRLEAVDLHGGIGPYAGQQIYDIRVFNRKNEEIRYTIPAVEGMHGGGDDRLLKILMEGGPEDPLGRLAGTRAGAMSIMIGIAANESIRQGQTIRIGDLLKI
jgi:hypothetical protein